MNSPLGSATSSGPHQKAEPWRKAVTLALVVAACWPLWPWSMERWLRWQGMLISFLLFCVGLAVWASLVLHRRDSSSESNDDTETLSVAPLWQLGATSALLAYTVFYNLLPISLTYTIAMFGFICILMGMIPENRRRKSLGLIPLVMLSLPVMPSIEYVFSYPLRALVARVASFWLGNEISYVGVGLTDGMRTVFVDAPCSGLRMLSTSIILSAASALTLQLSRWRTFILLLLGGMLALIGNIIRAVALFVLETRIGNNEVAHSAVGIIIFAVCAACLVLMALLLRKGNSNKEESDAGMTPRRGARTRLRWALYSLFVLSCLAAFGRPFSVASSEVGKHDTALGFEWPKSWDSHPLVPLKVNPSLRKFLEDFPGQMASFRVGETTRHIFLRWTSAATRKLHIARGCYRATGYRITPLPALKDKYGHLWSRFRARHSGGGDVTVSECYFSIPLNVETRKLEQLIGVAPSWPDASSWYWAAALPGSHVHATLAVTVAE